MLMNGVQNSRPRAASHKFFTGCLTRRIGDENVLIAQRHFTASYIAQISRLPPVWILVRFSDE